MIRAAGALDPAWSDYLGGLTLTVVGDDGAVATELRGELLDQAALLGGLTTLSDLGLPLLHVTCTPCPRA